MEVVFVRAYAKKLPGELLAVPLETLIVLFVFKCIQNKDTQITFVLEQPSAGDVGFQFCKRSLEDFNVNYQEQVPKEVKNCILPVVCKQNVGIYIAGLCAVVRRLLKISSNQALCKDLLGFRGGCLMACSEVSVWTKFCEIDLPTSTNNVCNRRNRRGEDLLDLLKDVVRLEIHLKQPVRVHNISKKRQDLARANKKSSEPCRILEEQIAATEVLRDLHPLNTEDGASQSSDESLSTLSPEHRLLSEVENLAAQSSSGLPAWMRSCSQFPAFENRKTKDWNLEQLIKQISELHPYESLDESSVDLVNGQKVTKVTTVQEELPQLHHLYAEGSNMTLADIILFPCIHHILRSFKNELVSLQCTIPLVLQWYTRMAEDHTVSLAVKGFLHQTTICDIKFCLLNDVESVMHATCNCNYCSQSSTLNASVSEEKEDQLFHVDGLDGTNDKLQEGRFITPLTLPAESLYIRDPKRYRPQSRMFTKQIDITNVLGCIQKSGIHSTYESHPCGPKIALDWASFPEVVHPSSGELPDSRIQRKCQQIESLVSVILKIAKPGDVIVDFCSGGGHVGIVLAYLLPQCQIIMIDNKEDSLGRAHQRVLDLSLRNVVLYQGNLDYFCGSFNIGTCLHACGVATDLVLQRCIKQQAAFVVCPCCYGAVQNTHLISYPRSAIFSNLMNLSYNDYLTLGHAADQNHVNNPKEDQGKRCMGLIDTDRLLQAEEQGYNGVLCTLVPKSCSPKHNLLIGHPVTWDRPFLLSLLYGSRNVNDVSSRKS